MSTQCYGTYFRQSNAADGFAQRILVSGYNVLNMDCFFFTQARPGFLCGLAPLQIGILLHHVSVEIVLPFGKLYPVAENVLCRQAVIFRQGNECQVHMGCFFVHVHHRRDDIFLTYPFTQEIGGPLEIVLYIGPFFTFEKLRAGGDEGIHKPGAVLAGAASRRLYPAVNLLPVSACGIDDVEVVLAFAGVDVGIAGVLFFDAFVVGLQRPGGSALVLCEP